MKKNTENLYTHAHTHTCAHTHVHTHTHTYAQRCRTAEPLKDFRTNLREFEKVYIYTHSEHVIIT